MLTFVAVEVVAERVGEVDGLRQDVDGDVEDVDDRTCPKLNGGVVTKGADGEIRVTVGIEILIGGGG